MILINIMRYLKLSLFIWLSIETRLMELVSKNEEIDNDVIFAEQLKRYEKYQKEVDESIKVQDQLLESIRVC